MKNRFQLDNVGPPICKIFRNFPHLLFKNVSNTEIDALHSPALTITPKKKLHFF